MLIKLSLNNETHLISKIPKTFKDLVALIRQSFNEKLPENFDIHYKDSDGDKVMIACDQDLEAMLDIEGSREQTLKITITPNIRELSSSIDTSNILIDKQSDVVEIVEEMNKMSMDKVELPKPNVVTVKDYEPPLVNFIPPKPKSNEFQEKPKEITETVKHICRKCEGSGFNVNKGKNCKRCEGKGFFEKKKRICKKCNGTGFNSEKNKLCKCQEKKEKCKKHHHFHPEKKETKEKRCGERLEKLKSLIDKQVNISIEKLKEELNLKKSREEFLQENLPHKNECQKKVHQGNPSNTVIHERYTCDGCGTHPIVGIRYKCSVCRDFDYCEFCEATIEHEHAFLKIKHPGQAPKLIFTALEQLPSTIFNFFKSAKKPEENKGTNTEQEQEHIYKEIELSFSEGINEEFPKIFEQKGEEKTKKEEPLGFEVKYPLKIIPELIVESTNFIFISITLKNSGKCAWPEGLRLENLNKDLKVDGFVLPGLGPNEEISLTLMVENPRKPQKYEMPIEIFSVDEKTKEKKVLFNSLKCEFEVVGPMRKVNNMMNVDPEEEEEKELKADKEIVKKAKSLKEIFGGKTKDFIEICEKFKSYSIDNLAEQVLNDRLLLETFSKVGLN